MMTKSAKSQTSNRRRGEAPSIPYYRMCEFRDHGFNWRMVSDLLEMEYGHHWRPKYLRERYRLGPGKRAVIEKHLLKIAIDNVWRSNNQKHFFWKRVAKEMHAMVGRWWNESACRHAAENYGLIMPFKKGKPRGRSVKTLSGDAHDSKCVRNSTRPGNCSTNCCPDGG